MIVDRPVLNIQYIEGTIQREAKDCSCGGSISGNCTVCPTIYYNVPVVHRVVNNKIKRTVDVTYEKEGTPKEKYTRATIDGNKAAKRWSELNMLFKGIHKYESN